MRKVSFCNGEFYHIYNRGVEKRNIFSDQADLTRFVKGMVEFNDIDPIGSLYENNLLIKHGQVIKPKNIVKVIAYALNPNHYHFILEQSEEKGIEKFMHRLGVGYTLYFNKKYKRVGPLFQGAFKAVHVDDNNYLLDLSVYINLNNKIHRLNEKGLKLASTSWDQYVSGGKSQFSVDKAIVIEQFANRKEYKKFALDKLSDFLDNKELKKDLELD